ncbi:MAG: ABC transporter substrate-binding protein [Polyangiales bacterium]
MDRRSFLLTALAAGAPLAGCTPERGVEGTIRVGFLANVTHAPMINAIASGRIQKRFPGVKLEVRTFRAGPRVCEALLGNAIDIGTSGPAPIVSMHARHAGGPIMLLSGVASGGASLIVRPEVKSAADLRGKRVATPQIGSTQDVSLRKWMAQNGLISKEKGGDVVVDAMASAQIMEEMRRGRIAATWMPEPWATRVVEELSAPRLIDERELWPKKRFPTSLLIARRAFVSARRAEADAVIQIVHEEIERAQKDLAARDEALAEIKRLTGKGLPKKVIEGAWKRVDFTRDVLPEELAQFARDAKDLGYVPSDDVRGLLA